MARRSNYFGHEQPTRIEIIPMIDVMMFLLVFFVLILLQMLQGTGITLQLPKSESAQQIESVKLTVGVNKQGGIFIDGQPVTRDDLRARLQGLGRDKRVDVLIAGDKDTAYDNIIQVMDLLREAGISTIALATTQ